jgi:hypothetical protein
LMVGRNSRLKANLHTTLGPAPGYAVSKQAWIKLSANLL